MDLKKKEEFQHIETIIDNIKKYTKDEEKYMYIEKAFDILEIERDYIALYYSKGYLEGYEILTTQTGFILIKRKKNDTTKTFNLTLAKTAELFMLTQKQVKAVHKSNAVQGFQTYHLLLSESSINFLQKTEMYKTLKYEIKNSLFTNTKNEIKRILK